MMYAKLLMLMLPVIITAFTAGVAWHARDTFELRLFSLGCCLAVAMACFFGAQAI